MTEMEWLNILWAVVALGMSLLALDQGMKYERLKREMEGLRNDR